MFNYVAQKINEILGTGYIVLNQFNPQSSKSKEMLNNYNVAVLNLEAGSVRPLRGIQGLQADCTLTIIEKIQSTDTNSNRIEKAINDLINASNGQITVQTTETNPSYDNVFDYVINYGIPKYREKVIIDGDDYALMDLSFSITLSHDALFGNSGIVSVWNETTSVYEEIEGVIRWDWTVQPVSENNAPLNQNKVLDILSFEAFTGKLTLLYLKNNTIHKKFINDKLTANKTIYKIKFAFDELTMEKNVTAALEWWGAKGQFSEFALTFSEAKVYV